MITVIGYERSKGTFTSQDGRNIDYDNTIVYGIEPLGTEQGQGDKAYVIKVKATVVPYDKFKVGQKIEVYYDKYKNVAFVNFGGKEV